jgi:2-C-methyl-D-erythritol 4-phosphate cytidylyltransferase
VTSRRVVAIVPAAGSGERLAAGRPKALVAIAGMPMVVRAVDGLLSSGVVDAVVVVAPANHLDEMASVLGAHARVVPGGADRVASVALGLAAVADAEVVLVHDAARCLCPGDVARAVVAAVREGHDAVIPALPVADTVRRVDPVGRVVGPVDRTGLLAIQTPQGFRPDVLRRAHDAALHSPAASRVTDDAGLVEAIGGEVVTVPGDPRAFKITTPLDLAMAEALLAATAPVLVSDGPPLTPDVRVGPSAHRVGASGAEREP